MTSPAFEMPAFPTSWDGPTLNLIRIVDPLGDAIAWFAPDHGARCAGYAVREVSAITHSLPSWRDIVIGPTSTPTVTTKEDDDVPDARWRFVERDPASCTMDWTRHSGSRSEYRRLTATLTDTRLSLVLLVHNAGREPIQTGAHMEVTLSSPPRIVDRLADDASQPCPEHDTLRPDKRRPVALIVDADPGSGTVRSNLVGGQIRCTLSDHRLRDPLPVIQPGMSRRLSVLIGAELSGISIDNANPYSLGRRSDAGPSDRPLS